MEFGINIATVNQITKKANFGSAISFLRVAMFVIMIPFFFSCAQSDTIAPANVVTETHSAAREAASVLNTDNFEDKNPASFWYKELWTPTAGMISREQQRTGKQSMRFSWRPAQVDGSNTLLHSEVATAPIAAGESAERWYGYSSFMPSGSLANDNQTVIVSQWHGVPNDNVSHTVPPLAISVEPGNTMQVTYFASSKPIVKAMQTPTSKKILNLGTASFDRWVDYVVHIKWDATGKTGVLEIWQDGIKIVNEQNISIGYPEIQQPYFKAGLYCWTGKSKYAEKVIYYDEVRIGNATADYNAVKPGRNDNSAK